MIDIVTLVNKTDVSLHFRRSSFLFMLLKVIGSRENLAQMGVTLHLHPTFPQKLLNVILKILVVTFFPGCFLLNDIIILFVIIFKVKHACYFVIGLKW
jgi:hypothetical protein